MKNLNVTALTAIAAVLAAGLLVSVAAQAETTAPQAGLTRAEVKAQLADARAKGELYAYRPAADFSNDIAPTTASPARTEAKATQAVAQRRQPAATPARKADDVSAE